MNKKKGRPVKESVEQIDEPKENLKVEVELNSLHISEHSIFYLNVTPDKKITLDDSVRIKSYLISLFKNMVDGGYIFNEQSAILALEKLDRKLEAIKSSTLSLQKEQEKYKKVLDQYNKIPKIVRKVLS